MTPKEFIAQFDEMDADYFMDRALANVPEGLDKRQGSIIFDAIKPVAYDYAQLAMLLQNMLLMSFTQTATAEFLDWRGQEKGLTRKAGSYAEVKAKMTNQLGMPIAVEVGDRFSSIGAEPFIYDVVSSNADTGEAILRCETEGTDANRYLGQLLPVTPQSGFGKADLVDVTVPARDPEDDDTFRERILATSDSLAYGGNIADYQKMIEELGTCGAVQVYPTWDGGGTVKLVIIDNDFKMPSKELVQQVQAAIMPSDDDAGDGYGLAPIGHTVSVVAPVEHDITVSFHMLIDGTTDFTTATASAKVAIEKYFDATRRKWGLLAKGSRQYALSIYRAQIFSAVMQVPGVINVTDVTLDGQDADVRLKYTRLVSELPTVQGVSIIEDDA